MWCFWFGGGILEWRENVRMWKCGNERKCENVRMWK